MTRTSVHYQHIERVLNRSGYHELNRPGKSAVKAKLMRRTGYSRAQLTRLIGQHRETGRIVDGRKRYSQPHAAQRTTWPRPS